MVPLKIEPVPGQAAFENDAMQAFIMDLEVALEKSTPGGLAIVGGHVASQGATMADFKKALLAVLAPVFGPGRAHGAGETSATGMLSWDPCAFDGMMIAATQQLVEKMAALTDRSLRWRVSQAERGQTRGLRSRSLASLGRGTNRRPRFRFFISYYRAEGGADARLLQTVLETKLGSGTVFLDATDAVTLDGILRSLARSEVLLLILTKSVLERPWVLIEIYEAVTRRLPVICVHVKGAGYDYTAGSAYLADLEAELGRRDAGALTELQAQLTRRGTSITDLQTQLSSVIPSQIAVPFDPATSDEQHLMNGLVGELLRRSAARAQSMQQLQKLTERTERTERSSPRSEGSASLSSKTKRSTALSEVSVEVSSAPSPYMPRANADGSGVRG